MHYVKIVGYSEFFWSVFSCIRTEYGEILRISPYSLGMQENKDQKISEYRHFWRSDIDWIFRKWEISPKLDSQQ